MPILYIFLRGTKPQLIETQSFLNGTIHEQTDVSCKSRRALLASEAVHVALDAKFLIKARMLEMLQQ